MAAVEEFRHSEPGVAAPHERTTDNKLGLMGTELMSEKNKQQQKKKTCLLDNQSRPYQFSNQNGFKWPKK